MGNFVDGLIWIPTPWDPIHTEDFNQAVRQADKTLDLMTIEAYVARRNTNVTDVFFGGDVVWDILDVLCFLCFHGFWTMSTCTLI